MTSTPQELRGEISTAPLRGETFQQYEKRMGHEPKLPKMEPTVRTSTVRQAIQDLLNDEYKSTLEIWQEVGSDRATVTNYLNEFYRAGFAQKEKRIHSMYWKLA